MRRVVIGLGEPGQERVGTFDFIRDLPLGQMGERLVMTCVIPNIMAFERDARGVAAMLLHPISGEKKCGVNPRLAQRTQQSRQRIRLAAGIEGQCDFAVSARSALQLPRSPGCV